MGESKGPAAGGGSPFAGCRREQLTWPGCWPICSGLAAATSTSMVAVGYMVTAVLAASAL
jgi:hypothetical protein